MKSVGGTKDIVVSGYPCYSGVSMKESAAGLSILYNRKKKQHLIIIAKNQSQYMTLMLLCSHT
jgi:hypothetical protein